MQIFEYPYIIITILVMCFIVLSAVGVYFAIKGAKTANGKEEKDYVSKKKIEHLYKKYGGNNLVSEKFPLSAELLAYLKYANSGMKNKNYPAIIKNPDELFAKSLLYPLVTEFLKTSNSEIIHNNLKTITVRKIVDYISENLTEKITLKSVSSALGINPATLSSILTDFTNIPFTTFVNNLRIERATRLLHEGDVTIAEAAYMSGFGSIRNFNRIFYDTLGLTPTEYKKAKP